MTKQDAIQNAYGEYWDKVKNNLTDSNWFKSKEVLGDFANSTIRRDFPNIEWECMDNYHPVYCYYFRPKSLHGIEDNNGWIKINSVKDIPEDKSAEYFVGNLQPKGTFYHIDGVFYSHNIHNMFLKNSITHFQKLEKPKPAIY